MKEAIVPTIIAMIYKKGTDIVISAKKEKPTINIK